MRNLIILLCLSFISATSAFALDKAPEGATYSDDGAHWYIVSTNGAKSILTVDGVVKATYSSIDTPFFIGDNSFAIAYDEASGYRYLLKNWVVIDTWETINTLNDYINIPYGKVVGWYIVDNGTYRLKDTTGKTLLENKNAGSSSYASILAKWVLESIIYDRNNANPTLYINDKKVAENANPLGVYKNKKKLVVPYTLTSPEWKTELYMYDVESGSSKKLPSYDGVGTYATVNWKSGDIKVLQYSVLIWEKYAIADISGKIISPARYDSVSQMTSYWDMILINYSINGEVFFSFGGKSYGWYNEVDIFNVSYASNNTSVKRWSIFVRKNGKDYIVVNGKEFAY